MVTITASNNNSELKVPALCHPAIHPRSALRLALLAVTMLASGCQDPNAIAMQIGQPSKDSLKVREAQTRVITASNQVSALSGITQNLQDLGFTIGESSADLGVVTGIKSRNAEETGQIAGQVALTVVLALLGGAHTPTWDKMQDIRVTTVVSPVQSPGQQSVRVSFDRYITNNHGQLWRTELIQDPAIYQEFFSKLSHADTLARAE